MSCCCNSSSPRKIKDLPVNCPRAASIGTPDCLTQHTELLDFESMVKHLYHGAQACPSASSKVHPATCYPSLSSHMLPPDTLNMTCFTNQIPGTDWQSSVLHHLARPLSNPQVSGELRALSSPHSSAAPLLWYGTALVPCLHPADTPVARAA